MRKTYFFVCLILSFVFLHASPMLDFIKSGKGLNNNDKHIVYIIIILVLALIFLIAAYIQAHNNRRRK